MRNFAKYFLFFFILLEIAFVSKVDAKPVPPGSGEGDVPANILILIDSSASMRRRMSNRDAIQYVPNSATVEVPLISLPAESSAPEMLPTILKSTVIERADHED